MPQRKVAVELEMEVARYARGGTEADTVTRRVKSSIHDLGDEADATGRDLDQLAVNADVAKRVIDDLGDEARGSAAQLAMLDREVDKLNRSLIAQRLVGGVGQHVLGGAEALFSMGGGRWAGIARWAVPIAAMLAPSLGAAIGTLMLGGIGTGGLIGGIVLAAGDDRVGKAFGQVGREIVGNLRADVAPFTEELVDVPDRFAAAWQRNRSGIRNTLGELAKDVDPIAAGLTGMVEHSLPGVERGIKASGMLAHQWAIDMPRVGDAVSDMFDAFARGAPGATLFFHDLVLGIDSSLRSLGLFAEMSSKLYNTIPGRPPIMSVLDLAEGPQFAVRSLEPVNDLNEKLAELDHNLSRVRKNWDLFMGPAMDQDLARLAAAGAIDDLRESVDRYGTSLSENSEKGRENRRTILDAVADYERLREANIANGMSIDAANQQYEDQISNLETVAVKLGMVRSELDKLLGRYELRLSASVGIRYTGTYAAPGDLAPHGSGRAAGGPAYAGQMLRVNEQRLEAFVAPDRGYVMPLVPHAAPMPVAAPTGWMGGQPVVHVYIGGERIDERVDVRVQMAQGREGALAAGGVR